VCDKDGQCFDGWPYTQNDGYLGQAAQNSSFTDADSKAVRDAVLKMQNPKQFSASYGHAFIRCGTPHSSRAAPRTAVPAACMLGRVLTCWAGCCHVSTR
jgi:hypothetical protein